MTHRILIFAFIGLFYSMGAWGQLCSCRTTQSTSLSTITNSHWECVELGKPSVTCGNPGPSPGDWLVIRHNLEVSSEVNWTNTNGDPVSITVKSTGSITFAAPSDRITLPESSYVDVENGGSIGESTNNASNRIEITNGETFKCGGGTTCPLDGPAAVGDTPLPVTLTYFKANRSEQEVELFWQTATEINNDYFEIQRSINGVDFEGIAKVSGLGNNNTLHDYAYQDVEAFSSQDYYYRLKQVDYDGKFAYSRVQHVNGLNESNNANIYLQRRNNALQVTTNGSNQVEVGIYNATGQLVWRGSRSWESDRAKQNEFPVSIDSGFYIVKVATQQGQLIKKLYW